MNKITTKMIRAAHNALSNAYAPYSKFPVACCIRTKENNLYIGVNVENGSYGLAACAESSAICNMVSSGEQQIDSIVILAGNNQLCPPCGACRQKIHEFSAAETLIHLCNKDSILKSLTITELLPLAFIFKP
jgi:cytidine deaminase